ncbi:hypothetical protein [Actinocrispum sp. NPDC049592]|uniref:hypothetical protein n=1 Tax=Actinocrispum sp. NPDC049592 TaxID=3154835 RepID=UPI00342AA63D
MDADSKNQALAEAREAFEALRVISQHTNVKLHVVAIVDVTDSAAAARRPGRGRAGALHRSALDRAFEHSDK